MHVSFQIAAAWSLLVLVFRLLSMLLNICQVAEGCAVQLPLRHVTFTVYVWL